MNVPIENISLAVLTGVILHLSLILFTKNNRKYAGDLSYFHAHIQESEWTMHTMEKSNLELDKLV